MRNFCGPACGSPKPTEFVLIFRLRFCLKDTHRRVVLRGHIDAGKAGMYIRAAAFAASLRSSCGWLSSRMICKRYSSGVMPPSAAF